MPSGGFSMTGRDASWKLALRLMARHVYAVESRCVADVWSGEWEFSASGTIAMVCLHFKVFPMIGNFSPAFSNDWKTGFSAVTPRSSFAFGIERGRSGFRKGTITKKRVEREELDCPSVVATL